MAIKSDLGWLQGFCLWTNFTTWTHFVEWDSTHPQYGLQAHTDPNLADLDGSLAQQLQAQPRTGDPSNSGIVFSNVAEIALLGALGSGEYLLRMPSTIYARLDTTSMLSCKPLNFPNPFINALDSSEWVLCVGTVHEENERRHYDSYTRKSHARIPTLDSSQ
jgi:hypothetical protein